MNTIIRAWKGKQGETDIDYIVQALPFWACERGRWSELWRKNMLMPVDARVGEGKSSAAALVAGKSSPRRHQARDFVCLKGKSQRNKSGSMGWGGGINTF